ncbi:MAG: glycosyltransferase family 4 protein, partial [Alphaproteobacteria bacterium]|nr:glycosyltransferase family 4 protein [Alphaproteobacteria bacterium]
MTILHIANWYPNPWDSIEGNFVRDQIRVFAQDLPAETIVVQVRPTSGSWPRLARRALEDGARGYFLLAPVRPGKMMEWLSTLLLVAVLLRERAWRFEALHFHIAYPLLLQSRLWRWMFRKPILISEHWTAYHYNFYLPEDSKALAVMRRPFEQGYPVFAVSEALLDDIKRFAKREDFTGVVLPNVVPLQGSVERRGAVPTFFAVNRWRAIKNPMPMLESLNRAVLSGHEFKLVIGGFGDMIAPMTAFVESSALSERTVFLGKLTKSEIAAQLARSDAYLFSSNYETFSVACAEALGAGVPLIGPYLPCIAEYAGPQEWVQVDAEDPNGWLRAVERFLGKWQADAWD